MPEKKVSKILSKEQLERRVNDFNSNDYENLDTSELQVFLVNLLSRVEALNNSLAEPTAEIKSLKAIANIVKDILIRRIDEDEETEDVLVTLYDEPDEVSDSENAVENKSNTLLVNKCSYCVNDDLPLYLEMSGIDSINVDTYYKDLCYKLIDLELKPVIKIGKKFATAFTNEDFATIIEFLSSHNLLSEVIGFDNRKLNSLFSVLPAARNELLSLNYILKEKKISE